MCDADTDGRVSKAQRQTRVGGAYPELRFVTGMEAGTFDRSLKQGVV
jgi:hypothetical protein